MADNSRVRELFHCNETGCDKSFKNKSSLSSHIKGIHEKAYVCKGCKNDFKDPSNLRRHQARCSMVTAEDKAEATSFICAWRSCMHNGRRDNVSRHSRTCKFRPQGHNTPFPPLRLSKEDKRQVELGHLPITIKQIGEEDLLAQQEAPESQFQVQSFNGAFDGQPAALGLFDNTPTYQQEDTGAQFQYQTYVNADSTPTLTPEEMVLKYLQQAPTQGGQSENVAYQRHNDHVFPAGQFNIDPANNNPAAAGDNMPLPAPGNNFQRYVDHSQSANQGADLGFSDACNGTIDTELPSLPPNPQFDSAELAGVSFEEWDLDAAELFGLIPV
ncbi:hypothetical protein RBB50_001356 [Rhinocladiella similis]